MEGGGAARGMRTVKALHSPSLTAERVNFSARDNMTRVPLTAVFYDEAAVRPDPTDFIT